MEQRTLEFGIRLALGADFPALRNMVVHQAMALAGTGIAVGLAAAYGLTRFLARLLFNVKPTDPLVFASVTLLFTVVALFASYLPARRALRWTRWSRCAISKRRSLNRAPSRLSARPPR